MPPFLSFISVASRQVLKTVPFPDATDGLEQPIYDAQTGMFYQAVPASTQNKGGQLAVLDPVKMAVVTRYNLNNLQSARMALGPGNQLLAGCNQRLRNTLLDKTNGAILAEFSQTGGGDMSWFNPGDNRYYTAATSTQTLGVIDANTMAFVENVQSGLGAHSVAADQALNHVFVPIAAPDPACPNGCIAIFAAAGAENNGVSREK